jgi:sulfur-carrier protein
MSEHGARLNYLSTGHAGVTTVTLQYYAQLREQTRMGSETWQTSCVSLRELYHELCRHHGFTLATDALKVAVNQHFVDWDRSINEGDVIVFIPPVAGG